MFCKNKTKNPNNTPLNCLDYSQHFLEIWLQNTILELIQKCLRVVCFVFWFCFGVVGFFLQQQISSWSSVMNYHWSGRGSSTFSSGSSWQKTQVGLGRCSWGCGQPAVEGSGRGCSSALGDSPALHFLPLVWIFFFSLSFPRGGCGLIRALELR